MYDLPYEYPFVYGAPEKDQSTCEAAGNKWFNGYCWTPEEYEKRRSEANKSVAMLLGALGLGIVGAMVLSAMRVNIERYADKREAEE